MQKKVGRLPGTENCKGSSKGMQAQLFPGAQEGSGTYRKIGGGCGQKKKKTRFRKKKR